MGNCLTQNIFRLLALLFLQFCFASNGIVQAQILSEKIDISLKKASLSEAFQAIEKASEAVFIYSNDYLPADKRVSIEANQESIAAVLKKILAFTRLTFEAKRNEITIKKISFQASEKKLFCISGRVLDSKSEEEIFGVNVYEPTLKSGVSSNQFGFYSLTLPKGKYNIVTTSIGYEVAEQEIELDSDTSINLFLKEKAYVLDSITVSANEKNSLKNIERLKMSSISVSPAIIRQNPPFFGESDPIKTLQLYPGIQSGGEGNTGFFVRGGSADQNLILIDGAPIYNSSHFLGFFSIFNPEAVKEIEVHKGDIPSKYGGRISSVIDLRTKEGNKKEQVISGGIGNLASRLTYEQPLFNGKGSMLLAGRRTYIDLLLKLIPDSGISQNTVSFYDVNFKFNLRPNKKNEFSLSVYSGADNVSLQNLFSSKWKNQTATFRWGRIISPKVFSNLTLVASNFSANSAVSLVSDRFGYNINYSLSDLGAKWDFTYFLNPKTQFDFGASTDYHRYFFGEILPSNSRSIVDPQSLDPSFALETAGYASMETELSPRLSAKLGLRFSSFSNIGKADVFIYDSEASELTLENVIDTVKIPKGEFYNNYNGFEPRVSLRYTITQKSSIKASYNRTRQYINQLSNTNTPSPVDMWAPINPYIKPQIGDQVALGYFRNFLGNTLEISLEGYYKRMQNQIDFKPLASLLLNNHLETEVLAGVGKSYGMEFLLRKPQGKLSGWISYTLSKAKRQIDGINDGIAYPTSFDRRHNFVSVFTYKFNERISLSANFVYASGIAYSFPVGKYEKDGLVVPYYSGRNDFRLPANHRLDLALTVFREMNEERTNESSFSFSIYNVYARKNTYAYVFRQNERNPSRTETVKLFLFTILPSFTYNFKF